MTKYTYNPHKHVKIWISNNPSKFMNLENQVRLIEMREQNRNDEISLVYDSSVLTPAAISDLLKYCSENTITPIDANTFGSRTLTPEEQDLYKAYKAELAHMKQGGNLAVASDILRWMSPVYEQGTYADFDYPIDTSSLPETIDVEEPLLLNIGSLKMGQQEFILANNDFVAIVDPEAAKEKIKKVQQGIIARLTRYDTDFIEKTEAQLKKNFINGYMLKLMRNRSESLYISKSKEISSECLSSLEVRNYIKQIMTDKAAFLDFNRVSPAESDEEVTRRLKAKLQGQLTLIKYLFFSKEYTEISEVLEKDNDAVLAYIMKNELNLYVKSIVVCTTGPIQISNSLFGGYVVSTGEFEKNVQPLSFNNYNLKRAFQSRNSIPMHESLIGMMRFLGESEGVINDSSWLESGRKLQDMRAGKLVERQQELAKELPCSLMELKSSIKKQVANLSANPNGIFNGNALFKERRKEKKKALEKILECFHDNLNESEFDVHQFQEILVTVYLSKSVFAGLFFSQTKKLIEDLEHLSHEAVTLSLTKNRKITWQSPHNEEEVPEPVSYSL